MKRRKFINRSAILGASLVTTGAATGKAFGLFSKDNSRSVLQVLDPHHTMVGTLPIIRLFPGGLKDYISPFVLFDEFGPVELEAGDAPLRVDAHPHAGIVPTSYFVAGAGHHKDNLNYDLQINQGEFMLFNSGRGAIHMEETGQKMYEEGGFYHGFQIWLNLPAEHKYVDPGTIVLKNESLPIVHEKDYTVKVVMGSYRGRKSNAETFSPAFYYHINTQAGAKLSIDTVPQHNAFVYSIAGKMELKDQVIVEQNHMAMFERGKSQIDIYTEAPAEFLLLGGQPLDDPIVSYGPFVMNTEEQIKQCIRDYQAGKMGDPNIVNQ